MLLPCTKRPPNKGNDVGKQSSFPNIFDLMPEIKSTQYDIQSISLLPAKVPEG